MSHTTQASEVERITVLLRHVDSGDALAAAELLPRVYDQLRVLARRALRRERTGHTLQATALVHEAWLSVSAGTGSGWASESHFFRAAAKAMRNILVDNARRHASEKRGGPLGRLELSDDLVVAPGQPPLDLLILDETLRELERRDPPKARILELRFFAGLSLVEVAKVLGRNVQSVRRDWRFARSWLQARLRDHGEDEALDA